MGGRGVGSIIRDRNDFVSNRYSIAFPQLEIVILFHKNSICGNVIQHLKPSYLIII